MSTCLRRVCVALSITSGTRRLASLRMLIDISMRRGEYSFVWIVSVCSNRVVLSVQQHPSESPSRLFAWLAFFILFLFSSLFTLVTFEKSDGMKIGEGEENVRSISSAVMNKVKRRRRHVEKVSEGKWWWSSSSRWQEATAGRSSSRRVIITKGSMIDIADSLKWRRLKQRAERSAECFATQSLISSMKCVCLAWEKASMFSKEKSQRSEDIKEKQKPHKLSAIIIDIERESHLLPSILCIPFWNFPNTSLSLWSSLDEHFEMISQSCFASRSLIFSTHRCHQIHLLPLYAMCSVALQSCVDIHMQDENVYFRFFCLFEGERRKMCVEESNKVWNGT